MSTLELHQINKIYTSKGSSNHIIKDANLRIEDGEFVVFVGPSGCGKSTMLRMIAGLEDISSGELRINDERVNEHSPAERGIGMVFQSYALYPHMTVEENIAFGLKYTRKWSKDKTALAVKNIAEALELSHVLTRRPSELSGGQRQRVAIGRALVRQPNVFLLDEPLSNLDTALRVRMRMQLAKFHRKFKSTTIYVTHDQVEAMTLADKVVLLNAGKIEQIGSPMELYLEPKTRFVAQFIGTSKMNMLDGTFVEENDGMAKIKCNDKILSVAVDCNNLRPGQIVTIGIRPEDVSITSKGHFKATVENIELLGSESVIYCRSPYSEDELIIRTTKVIYTSVDQELSFAIDPARCHLFDEEGNAFPRKLYTEAVSLPVENAVI